MNGIEELASRVGTGCGAISYLDVLFSKLSRDFSYSMRNVLSFNLEFNLDRITSPRFHSYISEVSDTSIIGILPMQGSDYCCYIVCNEELARRMVPMMLGGLPNMEVESKNRYTSIERSLISHIFTIMTGNFNKVFCDVFEEECYFDRVETHVMAISTMSPNYKVAVGNMSASYDSGKHLGNLQIIVPEDMCSKIGDVGGKSQISDPDLLRSNSMNILSQHVSLHAVVDHLKFPAKQVLNMKVGDQIMLDSTPDSSVKIVCQGVLLADGIAGVQDGKISVEIQDVYSQDKW